MAVSLFHFCCSGPSIKKFAKGTRLVRRCMGEDFLPIIGLNFLLHRGKFSGFFLWLESC